MPEFLQTTYRQIREALLAQTAERREEVTDV